MTGDQPTRVRAELEAVPETALWTLYHRAAEARRPDTVLPDQAAVDLVDSLDFPFAERFGPADSRAGRIQSRLQGLRVRCFDREVSDFLARSPRGTVVCLGEGLETQYWRVDNGRAQWLTVDLPELIALRERVLPAGPRQRLLAGSATDLGWADQVEPGQDVLITAQGLLMYLRPGQVRDLIAGCAERFPGAGMVFDTVPRWFGRLTVEGKMRSHRYQAPPMPWSMDAGERAKLATAHPAVVEIRDVRPTGGPGLLGAAVDAVVRLPVVSSYRPSVVALRFAARPGTAPAR
ncbi:class I SAM-dependent methyltransferase [Kitasatospora sp. NBC_00374]|uniref:class I SAM-dependent methyltransferase n=1 Tax=Kitasatospora sp. NBC_00374 TaxID=2975964 RepID=UPI0030E099B3